MAARLTACRGSVILLALALAAPSADAPGAAPPARGTLAADVVPGVTAPADESAEPKQPAKSEEVGRLRIGPVKLDIDVMARAESATDFSLANFTFTPEKDESRILVRARPALVYTPSGSFRALLEGQWYAYYNESDLSRFSVYQGFVEAPIPGVKPVTVKAGRQELVYGSVFMLGADTFYDGLSFDAVKLSVRPSEVISVDGFGGRYVTQNSGGIEGTLYGVYAAYAPRKTASVDLYVFRDTGGAGATHVGGEHERTYSLGTRLCGKFAGAVDVEVEPIWQFGRKSRGGSAHDDIRAFGGHADVTFRPQFGRHPGRVFLSYAYGSGDGNPADGTFREFHNPNNDTALLGDMNVIGDLGGFQVGGAAASGLRILSAGAGIDVTGKLSVALDGHLFRADRVSAGASKDIGIETDLVVTYRISEDVSVLASADRFFTGGFFKDAAGSGRDIGYYYLQVQTR